MNYYSSESPNGVGYWPLTEEGCPCDIHFREYLASRDIGGKSIFHFGTGAHHFVGAGELGRGNPNYVLAVTASPEEHADYIDLIIQSPRLARFYKVIFTDIYTLDGASLPAFEHRHLVPFVRVLGPCQIRLCAPRRQETSRSDDRETQTGRSDHRLYEVTGLG